ncbi:MAG: hypothetical protein IPH93_17275 [Saprospiraceae bacterium]|nr:hypothetical protein [Saprospiraceae bacterium]
MEFWNEFLGGWLTCFSSYRSADLLGAYRIGALPPNPGWWIFSDRFTEGLCEIKLGHAI